MIKASIIGHFGFGGNYLDGQTVKTKIVAEELKKAFGSDAISCRDTHGGMKFVARLPWVVLSSLMKSRNVLILPAYKGVLAITPLLVLLNFHFRRSLHYVVIGGWLPDYVKKYSFLRLSLKTFDAVYVETKSMKRKLEELGMHNIVLMPNCKQLTPVEIDENQLTLKAPFRVCTFSRVMKEKGIEDAIDAVKLCNKRLGYEAFTLDVYGQVWAAQQGWFDNLFANQPGYVNYRGCVEFSQSVSVLKDYFALLFPTFYIGEGVAGTFIDAFAAGLPVIVTDWHDNADIIEDGKTGCVVGVHDVEGIADRLIMLVESSSSYVAMRKNCIENLKVYLPANVIGILTERMQ